MVEKEVWDGLSFGGVNARRFSLKPRRSTLSDGLDNSLFL